MTRDYRDLLIEPITDQERARDRDLAATRELLHLALSRLHEVDRQFDQLRKRYHRLRADTSRFRDQLRTHRFRRSREMVALPEPMRGGSTNRSSETSSTPGQPTCGPIATPRGRRTGR